MFWRISLHLEGHRNFTSLKSDLVLRISDVSNNRVYFLKIRTLLFEMFFFCMDYREKRRKVPSHQLFTPPSIIQYIGVSPPSTEEK